MAASGSAEKPDVPGPPPGGPPAGEPTPAALLNSPDYELIRELSRGGMGVVYLVRSRRMDRLECLKVVRGELLDRAGSRERFEREMRSVAKVNHPHIVTAYSAPHFEGLLAFAMEYVDGIDLYHLVQSEGPLAVANACFYIWQAAGALQYAHEKWLVHRDIKPGNLILARDGGRDVIKILDFGLAKATSEFPLDGGLTQAGQILGSPNYMAPEQIKNAGTADIRADIYSLGCTLYYLLTGATPFQEKRELYEILHAQQFHTARPVHELRPEVPAELSELVAKMMAKDPLQRFQQPQDVARALAPYFQQGIEPLAGGRHDGGSSVPPASLGIADHDTRTPMDTQAPARAGAPAGTPQGTAMPPTLVEQEARQPLKPAAASKPGSTDRSGGHPRRAGRLWGRVLVGGLLLGGAALYWFGVIDVKRGSGTLVLEVNEPHADVYIDGAAVDVTWNEAGKQAELSVKAGDRRVEVTKEGFTVAVKEMLIKADERQTFKARLDLVPNLGAAGPPMTLPPGATAAPTSQPAATDSAKTTPATAPTTPSTTTNATPSTAPTTPPRSPVGQAPGEVRDDNGLQLKIVWCPPGKFTMGSAKTEKERGTDEDQVTVTLTKGFWLGMNEVTQAQWTQLMASTPWKGEVNVQEGAEFPVTYVNWDDAIAFCTKLTAQEHAAGRLDKGWAYALPSEAQWEYACRAGTTSPYSFGADGKQLAAHGWFRTNALDAREKFAHAVHLKQPNPWGLYDMHGNVFEWCRDAFTVKLPGGVDPVVTSGGTQRVYRSGGWFTSAPYSRSAFRRGNDLSFRGNALGFRVACVSAGGG